MQLYIALQGKKTPKDTEKSHSTVAFNLFWQLVSGLVRLVFLFFFGSGSGFSLTGYWTFPFFGFSLDLDRFGFSLWILPFKNVGLTLDTGFRFPFDETKMHRENRL